MSIMAATVECVGAPRGMRKRIGFGDRQSVHICSKANMPTALATVQESNNPRSPEIAVNVDSPSLQLGCDKIRRTPFFKG